ncbi:WxcM-like domain-containing protein [Chryseobacterium sp. PMSZPI]|uniref:WxcM-like domain-containing protein n=1 Tax=Chryseobacterium sp. PMSZPI TaxID=1033900 RepID=UPI000C331CFA|nr:WxcM-like domain-containing protein [Chryseobacterium sp. PMSZPI]PKF74309.1 sugar epimerase [Chryseobacterium sp. PMSZPI]
MLFKGGQFKDKRGVVRYNNDFDASKVKRIYTIENFQTDFIRGWTGHAIEQRWFACVVGRFRIAVIRVDSFQNPSADLTAEYYDLHANTLDFLHIVPGCITAIKAIEEESKLLVLADYGLNEIDDDYRFPLNHFNIEL